MARAVTHLNLPRYIEVLPNTKSMALIMGIFGNFTDIIRYTFPVWMILWIVVEVIRAIYKYYKSTHIIISKSFKLVLLICQAALIIESKVYILDFPNICSYLIHCLFLSFRKHLTHPYSAKNTNHYAFGHLYSYTNIFRSHFDIEQGST